VEEAVNACQAWAEEFSKKDFKQKLPAVLRAGGILNRQRLSDAALALCEMWLKNLGKKKNGWRTPLLREKGIALLNAQKWDEARECLEEALNKRKPNLFLQNCIAATWLGARKLNKAIAIYSKTREAAKKLNPSEQLEIRNNDLGHAFLLAQQPDKALPCFEEDLKLFEKARDKTHRLRAHFLIGNLFRRQLRDFNAAVKHYQAAAELAKDTKDNDWLMRIYNGLAGTYLDRAHADTGAKAQNHCAQALSFFEESLALCQYMKRQSHLLDFETAAILLNIGTVHREMGNFARGRDTFQTILKVFESKPAKSPQEFGRLCETYIALADCLSAEQKFAEMEEPLRRAWKIAKESRELLEHRLVIQLLWAEVARAKKDTGELREHLDQIEHLRAKYKINPTPMAEKRITYLKKSSCQKPSL
ncbi:MAG: tetratricopeptide repeat protein, partial [bacterium]|nr:tetratricopeptide repeat protein [bacterium]